MKTLMPTLTKLLLTGLFTATLAACAVGPTYQAPHTELQPFHNTTKQLPTSKTSAPTLESWWTATRRFGSIGDRSSTESAGANRLGGWQQPRV
jgi:hypothetical protein